jgi:hypothetical protein
MQEVVRLVSMLFTGKGLPTKKVVEEFPERIHISRRSGIVQPSIFKFRRNVVSGSDRLGGGGETLPCVCQMKAETKVAYDSCAVASNEDIRRLYITMNDMSLMRSGDGVTDLSIEQ